LLLARVPHPVNRVPASLRRRSALAALALVAAACEGGEPSALTSSPDTLRFEPLAVGGLSAAQVIAWSNSGADSVQVGVLRVSGEGAADFVVAEDLCDGATLAPGESCSVAILFGPREAGTRAAAIAAGTGTGAVVELRGEGLADSTVVVETTGLVLAVPETLDFGEQPVGTTAGPLGVRLVNRRSGAVQFAVRLRAGEASEYSIALDRCSNEILGPGRACSIQILFEPALEGLRAGELILRDLNGSAVQTVPLSGFGVAAVAAAGEASATPVVTSAPVPLAVSPEAIEFGLQAQGAAGPPRVVRVKNEGASSIVIHSLRVAGSDAESFDLAGTDCARRALVPTRTCSLEVVFRPIAPGPVSGRIEAQTSAGVLPALVLLGGTGGSR
jgi:hypothetical protein